MISKKITEYNEIDFDIQLLATELDTSVVDLYYLSRNELKDGISIENFDYLFNEIISGGEISSFTNEISLYEYLCEPIIIISRIDEKMVVFNKNIRRVIEGKVINLKFCD